MALIHHRAEATGVPSLNTHIGAFGWRLRVYAQAALLLRDHDVAWRAIDLIGQSPLPGRFHVLNVGSEAVPE
jgi:hypothetical protein